MGFKNKKEREEFLKHYELWELWKEIPEIEVKLYRYAFIKTGAVIVATEYSKMEFASFGAKGAEYKKARDVKYHLFLREGDSGYRCDYIPNEYKLYNPAGDSKSAIIDYLAKVRPEDDEYDC